MIEPKIRFNDALSKNNRSYSDINERCHTDYNRRKESSGIIESVTNVKTSVISKERSKNHLRFRFKHSKSGWRLYSPFYFMRYLLLQVAQDLAADSHQHLLAPSKGGFTSRILRFLQAFRIEDQPRAFSVGPLFRSSFYSCLLV